MSEATFIQEWDAEDYMQAENVIRFINRHGGEIVWKSEPKEPPPPAVCTCWEWLRVTGKSCGDDFDKPGPWHTDGCPLFVPF